MHARKGICSTKSGNTDGKLYLYAPVAKMSLSSYSVTYLSAFGWTELVILSLNVCCARWYCEVCLHCTWACETYWCNCLATMLNEDTLCMIGCSMTLNDIRSSKSKFLSNALRKNGLMNFCDIIFLFYT